MLESSNSNNNMNLDDTMKFSNIIRYAFIGTLVLSCGKNDEEKQYPKQINYKQNDLEIKEQSEFERLISRTFLTAKTPLGLGLLLTKNDKKSKSTIGSCTWFIINKNQAITNSHCIPKKLKEDTALDCSKYLGGVIKTLKGDKRFYCKKIVHVSKISDSHFNNPDYALIEINKTFPGISNFNFSRDGFKQAQTTTVHSIDTIVTSNLLYGAYRKKTCVSYQNSFFGAFISQFSSIIPIFDEDSYSQNCNIIPGNSGSPVTDSQDSSNTIGVAFASSKEGKKIKGNSQFDFSQVTSFALISNFSCLDIKTLNQDRDPDCSSLLKEEKVLKDDIRLDAVTKAALDVEKGLKSIFETLSPVYRYKLDQLDSYNINIETKCVLPLNKWPSNEVDNIEYRGIYLINRRPTYTSVIPNIGIEMKFSLNRYGIISNKVEVYRKFEKEYYIDNLETLSETPKEVGNLIITDPSSKNSDEKYPLRLRFCSEEELKIDELSL